MAEAWDDHFIHSILAYLTSVGRGECSLQKPFFFFADCAHIVHTIV